MEEYRGRCDSNGSSPVAGSLRLMAGRQKPSEIYLAWEAIVFPETGYESPTSQRGRDAFVKLWAERGANDRYLELSGSDAELLTSLGWKLAMEAEDYEGSLAWTFLMQTHPEYPSSPPLERSLPLNNRFFSYLFLKDIPRLCKCVDQLLLVDWRHAAQILFVAPQLGSDQLADHLIIDAAARVLTSKARFSRLAKRLSKPDLTYGDLWEIGQLTFPRHLRSSAPAPEH